MSCTEVYHWLMCQGHVILSLDGKNAKLQGFLQLLYNCGLKLFLMIALLDSLCVVWFANGGVCNSWNWIHTVCALNFSIIHHDVLVNIWSIYRMQSASNKLERSSQSANAHRGPVTSLTGEIKCCEYVLILHSFTEQEAEMEGGKNSCSHYTDWLAFTIKSVPWKRCI